MKIFDKLVTLFKKIVKKYVKNTRQVIYHIIICLCLNPANYANVK